MFIVPISSMGGIESLKPLTGAFNSQNIGTEEINGTGFKDVFKEAIGNVQQTEAAVKMDAYNLSIGKTDDMHTMMINAAKADIALQTMVQLRNKMIEAYSEVMRINI